MIGPASMGSVPEWLVILASEPEYMADLMGLATEVGLENLKLYWEALGDTIDIFHIDGFDFGAQDREIVFASGVQRILCPGLSSPMRLDSREYPLENRQALLRKHPQPDGMMIQVGIDILNPVQTSAANMDPVWLKNTFGDRITFWGGGVDTQRVLPFGTPQDVKADVIERLRVFGPGGGFIWNPIHNVQYNVPPENVLMALNTAYEYGSYPIAL